MIKYIRSDSMKKGQRLLCSDAFISTSNDKLFYKILSVQNSVDNNMDCQIGRAHV